MKLSLELQLFLIHKSIDNPAHLAIDVFLRLLERDVHVAIKTGKHLVNVLVDR